MAFVRFFESLGSTALTKLHLMDWSLTLISQLITKLRRLAVRLRKVHLVIGGVEYLDGLGKVFDSCKCWEEVYFSHSADTVQVDAFNLVTRLVDSLKKQLKHGRLEIRFRDIEYDDQREFSADIANAVLIFCFKSTYVQVDTRHT